MRRTEPHLKFRIVAWAVAALIASAIYLAAHGCFRAEAGFLGAWLTIGSGATWAISATLPLRRRRAVNTINFLAASLAAMSALCLLH